MSYQLKEVSKDDFFNSVGKLNVHPRPEPDVTYWETPNRIINGVTHPGYMARGGKRYFVAVGEVGRS